MSELTPCNYCSYKRSKETHEAKGDEVELVRSEEMSGWWALRVNGKEVGWYMEMPDRCCC